MDINKKLEKIFQKEIADRQASDSWDKAIAKNVLEIKSQRAKTSRTRLKYAISVFAPLCTAAVLLIYFSFSYSAKQAELLNNWINNQIIGVHDSQQNETLQAKEALTSNGSLIFEDTMSGELDDFIDDALSMR